MKHAARYSVISLGVDASTWRTYKSGVFTNCANTGLNHGVALVGYGTDEETGLEYFLIKNSWGTRYGEKGYIRLGVDNECGDNEEGVIPQYRC